MKAQSAIEYLTIFAVAILILAIVLAAVGVSIPNSSSSTPATCYLSPQLNCLQLIFADNGITSEGIVIFTNNVGQTLSFPTNGFVFEPSSIQKFYTGTCLPSKAVEGSEIVCTAGVSGYNPSTGTQLQSRFQILYDICQGSSCANANTNITGTGVVYVTPASADIYQIQLLDTNNQGNITVDGVPYPSNTFLYFIGQTHYSIYADPLSGNTFTAWTTSGGAVVSGTGSRATTAYATSNGVITMTHT